MQKVSDWIAPTPEADTSTAQVTTQRQAELARQQDVLAGQTDAAAPVQQGAGILANLPLPEEAAQNAEAKAQDTVNKLEAIGNAVEQPPAVPARGAAPEQWIQSPLPPARDTHTEVTSPWTRSSSTPSPAAPTPAPC